MKKRTPDKKKGAPKSQTSSKATEKRPVPAAPTKAVAAPMKKDAVVSDAPRAESRSVARSDQPTTRSSPAPEPSSGVGGWPPFRYPPR